MKTVLAGRYSGCARSVIESELFIDQAKVGPPYVSAFHAAVPEGIIA